MKSQVRPHGSSLVFTWGLSSRTALQEFRLRLSGLRIWPGLCCGPGSILDLRTSACHGFVTPFARVRFPGWEAEQEGDVGKASGKRVYFIHRHQLPLPTTENKFSHPLIFPWYWVQDPPIQLPLSHPHPVPASTKIRECGTQETVNPTVHRLGETLFKLSGSTGELSEISL